MKMLFRKIVLVVLLVSFMALLVSCSAKKESTTESGEKIVRLTLNHDGSTTHPYQLGSEKLKELAYEYSDGSLIIEIYPASQIASGTKAVEFVQLGTLDIALCASTSMVNFVKEFGVIDMPFLFKDKDEVFAVLNGDVGKEIEEAAEKAGFKVLGWADNGFKCVSNSERPITKMSDYRGLKIRVPETDTFIKMYEALGAVPTAMAVGEVYTAIQTGVVVGQDNTVANFVNNKYPEIQKYLTISDHIYTAEPFVMSTDKFNSLSTKQQEALIRAAKEACEYEIQISNQVDEDNLKIVKDAGVQIVYLEASELPKIREAVASIYNANEKDLGNLIRQIQSQLDE